jgi:hypothetical protein
MLADHFLGSIVLQLILESESNLCRNEQVIIQLTLP